MIFINESRQIARKEGSKFTDIKEGRHGLVEKLEYALLGEEVDVGCPSDEVVDVFGGVYVEVDVHAVHDAVPQDALHHLALQLARTARGVLRQTHPS